MMVGAALSQSLPLWERWQPAGLTEGGASKIAAIAAARYRAQFVHPLPARPVNPNLSAFGGMRLTNYDTSKDRGIFGLYYRLPYLIQSEVLVDTEADVRLRLGKVFQITSRFAVFAEGEYDTNTRWEWTSGAKYFLSKRWSLIGQYHSDHGLGAGLNFRF